MDIVVIRVTLTMAVLCPASSPVTGFSRRPRVFTISHRLDIR
ncbi:hypothetical protein ACFQZZ_21500 [Nocardia sp. GCM10030253]